ncbi:MAG: hypothetical protein AAB606_03360 [Patescibacteria group bacterium]
MRNKLPFTLMIFSLMLISASCDSSDASKVSVLDTQKQENKEEVTAPEVKAEEAKAPEVKPVVQPKPVTPAVGISLSGYAVETGVKLSWSVKGLDVSSGYKVVKGTEPNPSFPENPYQYLSDSKQTTYTFPVADGKKYYFRVCQYLGGKCGVYSNNISVVAPVKKAVEKKVETQPVSDKVSSIKVWKTSSNSVNWSVSGYSDKGFKLVWSKNSAPTYPTRSGDKYNYYSDPKTASGTVDAFSDAGSYHVRVCEYLGGACGVYSNEIVMQLE